MKRFATMTMTMTMILAGMPLLAGCGSAESADATTSVRAIPSLRPAAIDPETKKLGVESLLRNPDNVEGTIALSGVVVQAFEERGAFVMVDVAEFKSCGLDACTDATMPIRVPSDAFEGTLPEPADFITVIGKFRSLERGFEFDVDEVHYDDNVILARK